MQGPNVDPELPRSSKLLAVGKDLVALWCPRVAGPKHWLAVGIVRTVPRPHKTWQQIDILEVMDELHAQVSVISHSKTCGCRILWYQRWEPGAVYPKQLFCP